MAPRFLLLAACFLFISFQGRSQIDLQDPLGSAFRISAQSKLRAKMPAHTCAVIFSGGFQAFDPGSMFPQDFSCDADFYYLTGMSIPDAAVVVFSEPRTMSEGEVSTMLFLPDKSDYGLVSMGYEYRGKFGLQTDGVAIRATGQWKKFCSEVLNDVGIDRIFSKPVRRSDFRKPAERDFNYLGEKFYSTLAPGFAFDPQAQRYYKEILAVDTLTMPALMMRVNAMLAYEVPEYRDPILMHFLKVQGADALRKVQQEIRMVKVDLLQATQWLNALRATKSEKEMEALRKSAATLVEGMRVVASRAIAGKSESVLLGVAEYMLHYRACKAVMPIVIASGKHSAQPNYAANMAVLPQEGVVVVDMAWSAKGYVSRLARTIPIGGTFGSEIRSMYEGVAAIHQKTISSCLSKAIPGKLQETSAAAFDALDKRLIFASNALGGRKVLKVTYIHGIGLDLEEPTPASLAPDMVVSVQTAVYFPDEDGITAKWKGLGIVFRDMVRITDTGNEVLTQSMPIDAAAVEALARSPLKLPED